MSQYFNFERLINKYSTEFTVTVPSGGAYDDNGDYTATTTEQTLTGAILSHRENKIFKSSGTLTAQDKALYMLSPLASALQGAEVTHGNKLYTIGDELENAAYTGVYAYTLKFVSVFNEGGAE